MQTNDRLAKSETMSSVLSIIKWKYLWKTH